MPEHQTALLKSILARWQDDLIISKDQLQLAYIYLFNPGTAFNSSIDSDVLESIQYLKDLMETEGLNSLEEVDTYLTCEKEDMRHFMIDMMTRVDKEDEAQNKRKKNIFISYSGKDKTVYESFISSLRDHLREDEVWRYPHHGYTRANKNYLDQFTEHSDEVFIWSGADFRGIETRRVKDIFWKIDGFCENLQYRCSWLQQEIEMTINYDKLVEQIAAEKPLADISIKLGLTNLLCWSKSYFTVYDHTDCRPSNLLILGDINHYRPNKRVSWRQFEDWTADVFNTMLADKQWSILKSPDDQSWLTSDNPGFVIEKRPTGEERVEADDIWDKLRSEYSRFYYPLSKKYCLRITTFGIEPLLNVEGISFEDSSEEEWQEVNARTVSTRREMVIASDKKMLEPFTSE